MKTNDTEQILVEMGADYLAKVLLDLAKQSKAAQDLINNIVAFKEGRLSRIRRMIENNTVKERFKNIDDYYAVARKIFGILNQLEDVRDPILGLKLVASLFEEEVTILDMCDDSEGQITNLFHRDILDLFDVYARRVEDKMLIAKIIIHLNEECCFSETNCLIAYAGRTLSEKYIREMITVFQKLAGMQSGSFEKRIFYSHARILAESIKDPVLYKKICVAGWKNIDGSFLIDLAGIYLDIGDPHKALSIINNASEYQKRSNTLQINQFLVKVYKKIGDKENLEKALIEILKERITTSDLEELIEVTGEHRRSAIIDMVVNQILEAKELNLNNVEFMISAGRIDAIEKYILDRLDKLRGYDYKRLIAIAQVLEDHGRFLVTSLIYRVLLNSILHRRKAEKYVTIYSEKLDNLALNIKDWENHEDHESFKKSLSINK